MRIKFPFNIKQVSDNSVSVAMAKDGCPLVVIDIHPDLRGLVTDEEMENIYGEASAAIVRAVITVEHGIEPPPAATVASTKR